MKTLVAILALAVPLAAQSDFRKHYASIGGGAGVPSGDIGSLLSPSPAFRAGYGYRFHKNFQADIALDTVFHAAKVRDWIETPFGELRVRDYQFLVPMGARAILPLSEGKILLYGGGGGAYLRYQERMRQPIGGQFQLECYECRSRSGWGYYSMLGASVALDRYQMFRLGVSTRVYRANVSGDPFGAVPAIETADTWVNTAAEFTISF